jgi:ABC-type Co2+ transport system permease subunit
MHYTATLDGMYTGMWLMAGTTVAVIVIVSVTWYCVRSAESAAESEAKMLTARVRAFEAVCETLKSPEEAERVMCTLGLIEVSNMQ